MPSTEVLKPVESSMFSHAGYDDATWTLYVTFRSTGETRAYLKVPPELGDEVLNSKSLGSAFNAKIKGKFEHEIQPADPATAPAPAAPPVLEGGLSNEDIDSVLGVSVEAGGAYGGQDPTLVATVTVTSPDLDAQAAIALPVQKAPEIDSIVEQGRKTANEARAIVVRDAISYAAAGQMLKVLQAARDRAFAFLDPIRDAIYKAYQVAQKRQKEALEPIDEAMSFLKAGMGRWTQIQEQARLQRQQEANQAAQQQSEQQRQEQSQQLTLAEVQEALTQGDTARAEDLMQHPIEAPAQYVAPVHVASAVPDVKGIATRKNWKVKQDTLDMVAFLTAVRDGKFDIPRAAKLVQFYVAGLNQLARSMEEAFNVPGVQAYNDAIVTSRRQR